MVSPRKKIAAGVKEPHERRTFSLHEGLTFDDLLIVPGYSQKLLRVDLRARLAGDLYLNVPIMSAAMDTVTGARMAIAMAREGVGIIHRNLKPEDQAREVEVVKRSESGMISDPIVLPPTATLGEAEALMARFTSRVCRSLNRELRFCWASLPIAICVSSARRIWAARSRIHDLEKLVTAPLGTSLETAKGILQKHRIEKLPLVDAHGHLKGLITVKDIQKSILYPQASKDERGRLLVGAAVGVGADLDERMERMLEKDLDVVEIDTAHGHSSRVIEATRRIRQIAPNLPLIAGNVVTAEGTLALIEAGADAIKVGVGAGSICTTRVISGRACPDDGHLPLRERGQAEGHSGDC